MQRFKREKYPYQIQLNCIFGCCLPPRKPKINPLPTIINCHIICNLVHIKAIISKDLFQFLLTIIYVDFDTICLELARYSPDIEKCLQKSIKMGQLKAAKASDEWNTLWIYRGNEAKELVDLNDTHRTGNDRFLTLTF